MKGSRKVLVAGSRTAIGQYGKSLSSVPVERLAQHVLHHAMRRAGINAGQVDGVILGHAYQSSYTPNTARFAWVKAGWPAHVPGYTVQMQCGSGMKAIHEAMEKIELGKGDIFLAGGVESMSTIPYQLPGELRKSKAMGWLPKFAPLPLMFANRTDRDSSLFDLLKGWKKWAALPFRLLSWILPGGIFKLADDGLAPTKLVKDAESVFMSYTAQCVANTYGISRKEADAYALRSQELAARAKKSGRFALEIDAIQTKYGQFDQDEHPRDTSMEALGGLRGVFGNKDVTPGNSSGINDGACVVVVASTEKAAELGLPVLAELVDHCEVAFDPIQMGVSPVFAIRKLLADNNLTLADIDLIELNEAFAAQYLACEKLAGLDRSKVNVNGGAIALGHPIAMSGSRITLSLAHELQLRSQADTTNRTRDWLGIATLCIGTGQAVATLVKVPARKK